MRLASVGVVCLSIVGLTCAAESWASIKRATHINAQGLGSALELLAKEHGFQVLYRTEIIGSLRVRSLDGEFTTEEALHELLSGTGLTYHYLGENAVTIVSAAGALPGDRTQSSSQGDNSGGAGTNRQEPGRTVPGGSSPDRLRLAQQDKGTAPRAPSVAGEATTDSDRSGLVQLQEVVVTAEKRQERLMDVPVPVTAISGETLLDSNNTRIQDYYTSVPGFSVSPSPGPAGMQMLTIRGISTGWLTNPTVGVTVDDVPYGSSTNYAGNTIPDLDPADLARVEVLRGPQGTLYGASSMGGLVKFVTTDPSTESLSGSVQAGVSDVYNGGAPGYNFRASVNLPLTDSLAVRASAFTRVDPGYIDNPVLHVNAVNEARTSGGRLAGLWHLSDAVTLKVSALLQDTKGNGSNDIDVATAGFAQTTGLTGLQQNYLRGIGGYERKVQNYSATLLANLGAVDITAVSGYNVNEFRDSTDFSFLLGPIAQAVFGVGGTPEFTHGTTDKFSQEVRVSVPIGERVDWLIGGFYTHESSPFVQDIRAENPESGAFVGDLEVLSVPTSYVEYAGFTDLTVRFSDPFDVQIGGRESDIKQTLGNSVTLFGTATGFPDMSATTHALTYLLTPRYRISPDVMAYVRLSSGYRAGGINSDLNPLVPRQFNPDKTEDYEVGVKGTLLDHVLLLDASLYYIDWKDVQFNLVDPSNAQTYTTNAGHAKSQGLEFSSEVRPWTGFKANASLTWNDAELTQALPADSTAYGTAGDRLPFTARFSGNLAADQHFRITGAVNGFVGATVSYVGERPGNFAAAGSFAGSERQSYPAYTRVDMRAGATYENWKANLYVTNVCNERGVLGGGVGNYPPFAFSYIQPRTVGLSLSSTF